MRFFVGYIAANGSSVCDIVVRQDRVTHYLPASSRDDELSSSCAVNDSATPGSPSGALPDSLAALAFDEHGELHRELDRLRRNNEVVGVDDDAWPWNATSCGLLAVTASRASRLSPESFVRFQTSAVCAATCRLHVTLYTIALPSLHVYHQLKPRFSTPTRT